MKLLRSRPRQVCSGRFSTGTAPCGASAITGSTTMKHLESRLAAAVAVAEVSDDVLDRIDEIVPPG